MSTYLNLELPGVCFLGGNPANPINLPPPATVLERTRGRRAGICACVCLCVLLSKAARCQTTLCHDQLFLVCFRLDRCYGPWGGVYSLL